MSQKLLSSWKLHFLKCLSVSTYWFPNKWPNHLHTICQQTLLTLIKCSLALFMSDNTGKKGQNLFFIGNFAFFSQIFVISTTSLVPKNWSYYILNNYQNTLWTVTNCSLTFVMFDHMGTNRPKSSLYWKSCFFFQKIVFSRTSWVLKNWSYYFNSQGQNTLWTLLNWSLSFVMPDNTRKTGQLFFFHWKFCLFFSISCPFKNFLCLKGMVLKVKQQW